MWCRNSSCRKLTIHPSGFCEGCLRKEGNPIPWDDNKSTTQCLACYRPFTFAFRKHHCRQCGKIFCASCSDRTLRLENYGSEQRVCQGCYVDTIKPNALRFQKIGRAFHQRKIFESVRSIQNAHFKKILFQIKQNPYVLFLIFFQGVGFTSEKQTIAHIENRENKSERDINHKRGQINDTFHRSYFLPLFKYFLAFLKGGILLSENTITIEEICTMRESIIGDSVTSETCMIAMAHCGLDLRNNDWNEYIADDNLLNQLVYPFKTDRHTYICKTVFERYMYGNWPDSHTISKYNMSDTESILKGYNKISYCDKNTKKHYLIRLIRRMAIYHPLADGNGRVFYMMLLNMELLKLGESPTLQFDPNFFETLTEALLLDEVKEGQARYEQFITYGLASYRLSPEAYDRDKAYVTWEKNVINSIGLIKHIDTALLQAMLRKMPDDYQRVYREIVAY